MKKIFIIIIIILSLFLVNINATSKGDIISYVNGQNVCGDTGIFNSYKSQFTRMIKQKEITEENLNKIFSYLKKAVGILNSKGACKLSDLSKLTEIERKSVYNSLMAGANIITSSPTIDLNKKTEGSSSSDENATTNITIDTKTNTMDIYEDGVLVDKIPLNDSKMTYTGNNIEFMYTIILCLLLFVISFITYLSIYKKHTLKIRIIKNIVISFMICTLSLSMFIFIFKNELQSFSSFIKLMSFTINDKSYNAIVSEDKKTIKTPSYGYNYGKLYINSVNIKNDIYFGDDKNILSLGIGHTSYSDMPGEGGIVIYSGHNRESILYNLKDIKENDKIIIDTSYANIIYTVKDIQILKETDTDKLVKYDNLETLILYTCYPFDNSVYSTNRYVIFSTLENIEWK